MKRLLTGFRLIATNEVFLLLLATSCPGFAIQRLQDESQRPINTAVPIIQEDEIRLKGIADDRVEPYITAIINERSQAAGLSPLKTKNLNDDDVELRIWVGFGLKPLEGFAITRLNGQWEGIFLKSLNATTRLPYHKPLSSPKLGWEHLWNRLVNSGLFVLPDSSQLKDEVLVADGTSYLAAINTGGRQQNDIIGGLRSGRLPGGVR